MGNVQFFKMVVSGGYDATGMTDEIWQFGVHYMPTLDAPFTATGTPLGHFDAAAATLSASASGYTVDGNFLFEGGVNDINPVDLLEDQIRPAIVAYMGTTSLFPATTYCDRVEIYPMSSSGAVLSDVNGIFKATLAFTDTGQADGTGGSAPALAPFTTFATSLVTPANTPRGRGRFYPPAPMAAILGTNGLAASGATNTIAVAGEALLSSSCLNDTTNNIYTRPVVIGSPFTTAYPVTGVKVGSIPDTQRRRRNSLDETYASVSFSV